MSDSRTDFDSNTNHNNGDQNRTTHSDPTPYTVPGCGLPRETPFGQRGSESYEPDPYSGNPLAVPASIGQPASRDDGAPAPGGHRE
jgi:hypothetical protein